MKNEAEENEAEELKNEAEELKNEAEENEAEELKNEAEELKNEAEENEAEENEAEELKNEAEEEDLEQIFEQPIKLDENSPEVICMNLPGHFDNLMKEVAALIKCGRQNVKKLAEDILSRKKDMKARIQRAYKGVAITDPSARLNAGKVDPFARSKLLAIAKLTRPSSKDLSLEQFLEVTNLFQQSGFTDLIRALRESKDKKLANVAKRFDAIVIGTQRFFLGQIWRYTELIIDEWDQKPVSADTVISGISHGVEVCLRCLLASMNLRLGSDAAVAKEARCADMPNVFCFQEIAKAMSELKDNADMKHAYDYLSGYVSNVSNLVLMFLIILYKCDGPASDFISRLGAPVESVGLEKPMTFLWQTCINKVGSIYKEVYDCTVGDEQLSNIRLIYQRSLRFALEGLDMSSPFEGIDVISNDEWLHPKILPTTGNLEDGTYVSRYKDLITTFNRITLLRKNGDITRKLQECFAGGEYEEFGGEIVTLFDRIYTDFRDGKKFEEYREVYRDLFRKVHPDKVVGLNLSSAQKEIISRVSEFISQVNTMEKDRVFPGEKAWDDLEAKLDEEEDAVDETGLVKKRKEFGFYESKPKKARYSEEELKAASGVVNVQGW